MPNSDDRYLLKLRALHYHYKEKRTQTETAHLLGISRVTLGKLIKEAWDEGMIHIEIVDHRHMEEIIRLNEQLQSTYNLEMVKVVDCPADERSVISYNIAKAAANYVDSLLHNGITISVSWGATLQMMADSLPVNNKVRDVKLYTLLGTAGFFTPQTQPTLIVQSMLQKIHGQGYIINAPFICESESLCEAIKQEAHIKKVLQESREAELILVGIGESPDISSQRIDAFHYSPSIISEMHKLGAVGDISGNFYDIDGNLLNSSIARRIVAVDIRQLKGRPGVLCLGGGEFKVQSLLGALNGGYFSQLITDKFTAKKILAQKG